MSVQCRVRNIKQRLTNPKREFVLAFFTLFLVAMFGLTSLLDAIGEFRKIVIPAIMPVAILDVLFGSFAAMDILQRG